MLAFDSEQVWAANWQERRERQTAMKTTTGVVPNPLTGDASARTASTATSRSTRGGWRRWRHLEAVLLAVFDVAFACTMTAVYYRFTFGSILCLCFLVSVHLFNSTYRRPRLRLSALSDMWGILTSASSPLLLVAVASGLKQATPITLEFSIALVATIALARIVAYTVLRVLRRLGVSQPVILIGSGPTAERLRSRIGDRTDGMRLVGYNSGAGLVGDPHALIRLVDRTAATRLIVAESVDEPRALLDALRALEGRRVELFIVPRLYEFGAAAGDRREQVCHGIPLVWLPRREWRTEQLIIKRAFDIAFATIGILLTAPIQLAAAVAVRFSSPGGVLFHQVRVGKRGRTFDMLKFRTMRVADPNDGPLANHETLEAGLGGGGSPRITSVGKWLRRFSIDELPQLWNVLRGDMSMVGPRPERPAVVEACNVAIPGWAERHRMHVGLTGLAQVSGCRGTNTSLEDRAVYDNYYIDHWSTWGDLSIVARTLLVAAQGS